MRIIGMSFLRGATNEQQRKINTAIGQDTVIFDPQA
jgi:hypothetical protein